ncbi:NAD-dependent aldehyde dehydrogenase [Acetobacter estunensis NRIC 0472]|uniref:HTH-type transcriptional regulator BetI n=1 Tax=Acetobacter estunensis TaxID=104097 RepID=A0A967B6G9_9PROT|nr:betaine-aldehyde dehydrogenase [Acetobacter estunensis]NHO54089.1 betaine-aldehyde dehydrogenase [Acetobacter estunensis]GBQ20903.1 NAD-dependent aldehyde dehydrogenase [Acetobacter estunensis NRIC 0472]
MQSPNPSSSPRLDDERRQNFIAATMSILAEHGYVGTTLARIAERAEVSPSLLVHYFGDKDSLLGAAFWSLSESLWREILRRFATARDSRARLQAIIDSLLAPEQFRQREGAVWLSFWGQVPYAPTLKRIQHIYQRRMLSNLSYDLRALVPAQEVRPLATAIASLIDGTWLRAALSEWQEANSAAARTQVTAFLDSQIARHALTDLSPVPIPQTRTEMKTCHNWIDGQFVTTNGPRFETRNPATGELLAEVETAGKSEHTAAIASARRGQKVWSRMTGTERGRVLHKAAELLRRDNAELAHLETLDTGKPIAETSTVDILSGADALEYFGSQASSLSGESIDLGPEAFGYTRREPLGITAGIGAWNYPIQIACWKSAPALACGNAMIFKSSEMTPLTAVRLAAIYKEAGLPDGVFNVLHGAGDVGKRLCAEPEIRKISLTGSVPTGIAVMREAANTLKYVTLELGGKSPLIIFDDADINNAVSAALLGNFYSGGEICSNGTRVFVQSGIRERFLSELKRRVEAMRIGDPLAPDTDIGALISASHLEKVLSYVKSAINEGATLLTGGKRLTDGTFSQGAFMQPTVFVNCRDDMKIAREEIFGPVMTVLDFTNEEEVIARANATEFGLAAGVFTSNLARGHRVVAALEAGTCWINQYNITPIELPFGGYKKSGLGRENSRAALEHYTQIKTVYVALGDVESPY